jgi:hypothetical protein
VARYTTSIASSLTKEAAFDYMAAFENAQHWDPGVAEAQRITEGPVALGTEFRVVTLFAGRQMPLVYKVTTFELGDRFVVTAQTSSLRSVDEVTVVADGTGSRVTYNAQLWFQGAFKLAAPLLPLLFNRIGDRARDGLNRELNPSRS